MRVADWEDHLEVLYHAIRELTECFEKPPLTFRRWVNQTLRGSVPPPIRERVLEDEHSLR